MVLLINSRLKRKLLGYCFAHPDESFYVRELAMLINEDTGNLSRELRKLEKEGLYYSKERGKTKLYSLNNNYPLFKELKDILFKTEGVEGSLKDLVNGYKRVSLAFVYGSYAKGVEKKESDIDLVLVGRFPVDEFTRKVRKLESKLNREINFTSYLQEEFDKERKKEGGFLNLILKEKVIVLKGQLNA